MKINQFTSAALATMLIGGSLVAQQTLPGQSQTNPSKANQQQQNQGQTAGTAGQRTNEDSSHSKEQILAKSLVITNQEQVQLAQFAKDKASHDGVKAFAGKMEKEHQECLEKLKGMASKTGAKSNTGNASSSRTDNTASTPASQRSDNVASNPATQRAGQTFSNVDFLQLHQEISEQCLKDSKEWLSKKEGAEFDQTFVGMQVAKHAAMKSNLTVLERHTTGELQDMIKASLEKTEEHMQAALNLMDQLTDSDSTRTARNPSGK